MAEGISRLLIGISVAGALCSQIMEVKVIGESLLLAFRQ
jgi:hypothetical protein